MAEEISLDAKVDVLPKVGKKRQQALNALGIETVYDLLQHYPFRYQDFMEKPLNELLDKEKTVLSGEVLADPVVNFYGPKRSRLRFRLLIGQDSIPITFFNQHWVSKSIHAGDHITVFGVFDQPKKALTASRLLQTEKQAIDYDYEPIYPSNKAISQKQIRDLIAVALQAVGKDIPEYVPDALKSKYALPTHQQAINMIHFPNSADDSQEARREIKFEEAFLYQLKLQDLRDKQRSENLKAIVAYDIMRVREFINHLPFEPTDAQKRASNDICADLIQPFAMKRLLQGDVGSGKTMVAALGMVATASAGGQSAMMAPTEILAEQHYHTLSDMLQGMDISLSLLTASTPRKERQEIISSLVEGNLQIVVGTHALIQDDVIFKQLQFVVTDEQHRFGVKQREALEDKGIETNCLHMTATPIPRTLSITTYGTIDVSILNELPKGRQAVQTRWIKRADSVLERRIASELADDGQVYVISPLIDESESLDLHTAESLYNHYQQLFAENYNVGLLHGQLSAEEKEEIMQAFKRNNIQLLISTTVIEVGVDVPNASLMVIYDADRFGLAQLHQLRGRIGRGSRASECILIAQPKTENGRERLRLMTETNDGFLLSEKDLEMRGPGDIFGQRQAGVPEFKLLDLATDYPILASARYEAQKLYHSPTFKEAPAYDALRRFIQI